MPIYDFYCKKCPNQDTEILVKPDEVPLCPICLRELTKKASAPMGYVKGTKNPVKHR